MRSKPTINDRDYDFHPEALPDLVDIWEFTAADNPIAANRVIAGIPDPIEKLVPFPHRGYHRPELTSRPLRFTNRRDYLIAASPALWPRS